MCVCFYFNIKALHLHTNLNCFLFLCVCVCVLFRWDPPTKNPNVVDGYRIFYHEAAIIGNEIAASETMTGGALAAGGPLDASTAPTVATASSLLNSSNATSMQMAGNSSAGISSSEVRRIDVKETSVNIDGLKKDVLYELVVKAGNTYGKLPKTPFM